MIASDAEGIYVYDESGRRYIDGPGGMWSSQIGYGRQEMADAIAAQVLKLPFTTPWTSTSGPAAQLAAKIAAESPGDLNNVFFTTGGSTAVDTALRFSKDPGQDQAGGQDPPRSAGFFAAAPAVAEFQH